MAQTDNPNPKMQLPEIWATQMACPICNSRPLGVFHPSGQADRFACPTCETSFELEDGGRRVRFVTLPQGVTPWMRGLWVVLEEALAAFEIFRNSQSEITVDGPPRSYPAASADQVLTEPPSGEVQVIEPSLPEQPGMTVVSSVEQENSQKPSEYSENDFLLSSDKPAKSSPVISPFYEEDFTIPVIQETQKPSEKTDSEAELWKNQEEERVKEALVHPPGSDFAGRLAVEETRQVDESENKQSNGNTLENNFRADTTWSPEYSAANRAPVEFPVLDNPPPIRPLEDTPPSIIQPARLQSRTVLNTPGEDLGDLRSHISVASNAPSVSEKMDTATERAIELHKLGNTDQEVRSILERSSGLTPEQVTSVLKNLDKPEERKRTYRLLLIFSIITIVIFTLLTWWFFSTRSFLTLTSTSQPVQSTNLLSGKIVDSTSLPAPLQTLMPNGIQILNESPSVEASTEGKIPAATCPKTKAGAASLFGGSAKDWSQEGESQGWILVTKTQSLEIKIPANMTGGYLVFEKGPEMRGVTGPAIVRNIYMISISCQ